MGLFIGRISKGRTIRNVVFHSYAIPLGYSIMWFGVFGGVGLRQSRQAEGTCNTIQISGELFDDYFSIKFYLLCMCVCV